MPAKKVTKAEKAEEVTEAEAEKMPEQLKEKVQEKKDGSMAKEKETPEAEAEMAEGSDNDAKVKEVKGDELKKPQDKISEEKKASTSGKKAKAVISSQEKTMKGTEEDADSNSDQPDSTSPLPKEVLEEFAEDVEAEKKPEKIKQRDRRPSFDEWAPVTALGKKVKNREITDIDDILSKGLRILEPEIVEMLLPDLDSELLLTGQAKGKFGGGKRRVFKQTQKKTAEGNKPRFATVAVVGDNDGHVGIGFGKSKDTVPAREKATKQAKLNVIKIKRGCGSWECGCKEPHSIPFRVFGKSSSVEVTLLPAPKGNGIVAEKEVKKVLEKAGIKDIWVNAEGLARNKFNLVKAVEKSLYQLSAIKINDESYLSSLGIIDGSIPKKKAEPEELELKAE